MPISDYSDMALVKLFESRVRVRLVDNDEGEDWRMISIEGEEWDWLNHDRSEFSLVRDFCAQLSEEVKFLEADATPAQLDRILMRLGSEAIIRKIVKLASFYKEPNPEEKQQIDDRLFGFTMETWKDRLPAEGLAIKEPRGSGFFSSSNKPSGKRDIVRHDNSESGFEIWTTNVVKVKDGYYDKWEYRGPFTVYHWRSRYVGQWATEAEALEGLRQFIHAFYGVPTHPRPVAKPENVVAFAKKGSGK